MTFEDIKKTFLKYNPDCFIKIIRNEKMKKDLLFVSTDGTLNRIEIFDEAKGLNKIAVIMYSIRRNRVFVSEIEVNENYQENGIGRFMFEFAMAHGDLKGATSIFGYALPTNNIKRVSSKHGLNRYEEETLHLIEIYKKLGCKFKQKGDYDNEMFEQTWKSGEKFKGLSENIQNLAKELVKHQKDRNFEMVIDK